MVKHRPELKARIISNLLNATYLTLTYSYKHGEYFIAIKIPSWAFEKALEDYDAILFTEILKTNDELMQKTINHAMIVYDCANLLLFNQNKKELINIGQDTYVLLLEVKKLLKKENGYAILKTIYKELRKPELPLDLLIEKVQQKDTLE